MIKPFGRAALKGTTSPPGKPPTRKVHLSKLQQPGAIRRINSQLSRQTTRTDGHRGSVKEQLTNEKTSHLNTVTNEQDHSNDSKSQETEPANIVTPERVTQTAAQDVQADNTSSKVSMSKINPLVNQFARLRLGSSGRYEMFTNKFATS